MQYDLRIACFLWDVGDYIKTRALEAKVERDRATLGTPERELHSGRVLAFNEIISILQQTALGSTVPLEDLQLDGFDPDKELV